VMHTYERSLVEQYRGQSFVVLGVNADPDRQTYLVSRQKENQNWRSILDGQSGPNTLRWGIEGFPTVFLLDRRGAIRYKCLGPPTRQLLEQQINILLKEPT
jgi:hypothetical protein